MGQKAAAVERNLFEIENARNLTLDEAVGTFVPTQTFWRLLSAKHHVVLGSRGSGKTALARMLSHSHLSRLTDARAKEVISSKAFIGIYLPTRLEWVGGLINKPWFSEKEMEEFFQWRVNIATCCAFLNTVRSCLDAYLKDKGQRALTERELCLKLSEAWTDEGTYTTTGDLGRHLEDIEYRRQQQIARFRASGKSLLNADPIGAIFNVELFGPLHRGISLVNQALKFPINTSWLLCLDEAEFLEQKHLRIINSFMRAFSANLFFKITTMPYSYQLSTTTSGVSIDPGHDFEFIYLDRDPVYYARAKSETGPIGTAFSRKLFLARAHASGERYSTVDVDKFLGESEILDSQKASWGPRSQNFRLLERYATDATVARVRRLLGSSRFMSEVGRKIRGPLMLRHQIESLRGSASLDVYSGATMVMRCGGINPRQLIRIFNALLLEAKGDRPSNGNREIEPLSKKTQTRILSRISSQTLAAVQSEKHLGPRLHEFITMIGEYMTYHFHKQPLTTDSISSIYIGKDVTYDEWLLIERAVALGLLYPQISPNNPDELPFLKGTFQLSHILAPHFRLLPRRGKAHSLSSIHSFHKKKEIGTDKAKADRLF